MTVLTNQADNVEAVTLMQAAILARVHLTNLYSLRTKLGAFKRDGVWHVPTATLQNYIQERAKRAQAILTTSSTAAINPQRDPQ